MTHLFNDQVDTALAEASVATREVADVLEMARQQELNGIEAAELIAFANATAKFSAHIRDVMLGGLSYG